RPRAISASRTAEAAPGGADQVARPVAICRLKRRPDGHDPLAGASCGGRRADRSRKVYSGRMAAMLLTRDEMSFDFAGDTLDPVRDKELVEWVMNQFLYGEMTGIQGG